MENNRWAIGLSQSFFTHCGLRRSLRERRAIGGLPMPARGLCLEGYLAKPRRSDEGNALRAVFREIVPGLWCWAGCGMRFLSPDLLRLARHIM